MKKAIVILSLFAVIIGIAVFETVYVDCAFKRLDKEFSALEAVLDEHQDDLTAPACVAELDKAMDLWSRKQKGFSVTLPHNSVAELTLKFSRFEATVLCNDYEMSKIELYDLLRTMPGYNTRYKPYIENIL